MKLDKHTLGFIGLLIISPALFPIILIADYIDEWNINRNFMKGKKTIKCWKCHTPLEIINTTLYHERMQLECKSCGHYSH